MIVWGGTNGLGDFDTGGRYSPGMDSWTATSTANAPASRDSHTAVRTSNEMIIWGGQLAGTTYANTGGRDCAQSGATAYSHSNTYWHANIEPYRDAYSNRNTEHNTSSYSHTEISPSSKISPAAAAAPDTCANSAVTTSYCLAATNSAASHNTCAAPALAASYSRAATLVITLTTVIERGMIWRSCPLKTADTTAPARKKSVHSSAFVG